MKTALLWLLPLTLLGAEFSWATDGGLLPELQNAVLRISLSIQDASLTVVDPRTDLVWRQQVRPGFRVASDGMWVTPTSLFITVLGGGETYTMTISLTETCPNAFDLLIDVPGRQYTTLAGYPFPFGFADMVNHGWLTADRSVQLTDWDTGERVVVNFGESPFVRGAKEPVPPRSFIVERTEGL